MQECLKVSAYYCTYTQTPKHTLTSVHIHSHTHTHTTATIRSPTHSPSYRFLCWNHSHSLVQTHSRNHTHSHTHIHTHTHTHTLTSAHMIPISPRTHSYSRTLGNFHPSQLVLSVVAWLYMGSLQPQKQQFVKIWFKTRLCVHKKTLQGVDKGKIAPKKLLKQCYVDFEVF